MTTFCDASGATALSQTIEWLGLRLSVPEDWQIVRHGLKPAAGRLVFIDRRRERCNLLWTHCPAPPDLERLEHEGRERAGKGAEAGPVVVLPGPVSWRGFVESPAGGEHTITRLVHWDAVGARLLELVTIAAPDDPLPLRIAGTVTSVAAPESARRWCAFDLDVTVPPGFRLAALVVRPADATFRFRRHRDDGKAAHQEASVRRLGMADTWHDGDLARLLRRLEPEWSARATGAVDGASLQVEGVEPGPRYRGLLGLLRTQRAHAWANDPENSVYVVTTRSPRREPLAPTDFAINTRGSA